MELFGSSEFARVFYAMALSVPRVTVALWVLPFLSQQILTRTMRSVIGFALASLVMPLVYHQLGAAGLEPGDLLWLLPKEILVGLLIGFVAAIPFWVAAGLGALLDTQRGSSAAIMSTPTYQGGISPLGVLFTQAVTVLFFSTMGVHVFLGALYQSYVTWPVTAMGPALAFESFLVVARTFQSMFYWLALLGAPALILVLVIDLLLGVLNRFVPQINVFFLAMPFKAILVLALLVVYADRVIFAFAREWMMNPAWFAAVEQVLQ